MASTTSDFTQLMEEREAAARAFVNGDPDPLQRLATEDLPATFFEPSGKTHDDAKKVRSVYEKQSRGFDSGETSFEVLQAAAGDEIGYWTGIQHGRVYPAGATEPVDYDLRVTEIFRREGDRWKLVHRHADALGAEG
jgi:ketosteroid isomerase-like protein